MWPYVLDIVHDTCKTKPLKKITFEPMHGDTFPICQISTSVVNLELQNTVCASHTTILIQKCINWRICQ